MYSLANKVFMGCDLIQSVSSIVGMSLSVGRGRYLLLSRFFIAFNCDLNNLECYFCCLINLVWLSGCLMRYFKRDARLGWFNRLFL